MIPGLAPETRLNSCLQVNKTSPPNDYLDIMERERWLKLKVRNERIRAQVERRVERLRAWIGDQAEGEGAGEIECLARE